MTNVELKLSEAAAAARDGESERALALCDAVLEADPNSAAAFALIGSLRGHQGDFEGAREAIEIALALEPSLADAWMDLGNIEMIENNPAGAIEAYRRCVDHAPTHVPGRVALARALLGAGSGREAERLLRDVLDDVPAMPDAVELLAKLMDDRGEHQEALLLVEHAVRKGSPPPRLHAYFGYLLLKRAYRPDLAVEQFAVARQGGFDDAELYVNHGVALHDLGDPAAAIEAYDALLEREPGHPLALFHRALAELSLGRYREAWRDYESRLHDEVWRGRLLDPATRWQGELARSRRLLVVWEQGVGDELMYASCLPDLLDAGLSVILECSDKVRPVMAASFPSVRLLAKGESRRLAAAEYDQWSPLASLPLYLRPDRPSFPRRPYLRPPAPLPRPVAERLAALGRRPRIGVSWRGGVDVTRRQLRSASLDVLVPLLSIADIDWISLQYDQCADEVAEFRARSGIPLHHWADIHQDYECVAALVGELDMVITVCTAVVHLAGGMGKPVWVMAPFVPEWRYAAPDGAMDWYPAVTVVRQTEKGDWGSVVAGMRQRLLDLLASGGLPGR